MEELIKLNAMLRLHESNFLNMHWNSAGEEFDDAHKDITTGYYELCAESIDKTAEMIARLGGFAYNFSEVAYAAQELEWIVVDSDKLYNRADIIKTSQEILTELLNQISACLDASEMSETQNAGIKSELESIQESFDIEGRYINERRLATL